MVELKTAMENAPLNRHGRGEAAKEEWSTGWSCLGIKAGKEVMAKWDGIQGGQAVGGSVMVERIQGGKEMETERSKADSGGCQHGGRESKVKAE
ncbi:hypothetical protein M0R45_009144 [Rubus argutus]|uniref:Uncharacterized protein n=1 Tax=Rubus argutus TaxID=59490 RepID=A0AAW1Y3N1_RUBAR